MLLVVCLVASAFLLLLSWLHSRRRRALAFVVLFSATSWFLIRFGFGRIYTTFDEAYYLSTLKVGGVYSGVVTPLMLRGTYHLFHDPVSSLLVLSFVLFTLYPLLIWKFYDLMDVEYPVRAVLVLFVSSYYIWTANALRPQQLGVLVGLLVLLMHHKGAENRGRVITVILWVLLWVLLILTHVLSFFIFLTFLAFLSAIDIITGGMDFRRAVIEILTAIPAVLVFLKLPQYSETVYSIKWMLKHSSFPPFRYAGWNLSWLMPVAIMLLLVVPLLAVVLAGRLRKLGERVTGFAVKRSNLLFLALSMASMAGLTAQFWLGRTVYTSIYRSTWLLLPMQLGNLFFALTLLYGLTGRLGRWGRFERATAVMLFLGAVGLMVSFFMPGGYGSFGFRNWAVRVLQYMVFFGAPVAARVIKTPRPGKGHLTKAITVLLVVFTIVSVINVARPSPLYNYPYYWTSSDLKLVKHAGPGFVYEANLSPIPNAVSLAFLGWAYGFRLVPTGGNASYAIHPRVCVGGLCYAPFPYTLIPMDSVGDRVRLVTGRMPGGMRELAVSMLKARGFSVSQNSETVLVLGNSSTNPLIKRLQSRYLLPVTVNFSVLTGPNFVIYHAIHAGRRTCDAWMAYFTVQAVRVNGSNLVVISGPNYDAIFAGLWWFIENGRNSNFSYVVGTWRERDGKVLGPLRCGATDRNGFSFGDEVRIRVRG